MVPAFFMTTILRHVLPRPHRHPLQRTVYWPRSFCGDHYFHYFYIIRSRLPVAERCIFRTAYPNPTPTTGPDTRALHAIRAHETRSAACFRHRLQTRIRPSNSVRHGIRTSLRSRIQTPVRPGVLVRGPLPVNRIDTLPLYCISGCGTAHGHKTPRTRKILQTQPFPG